MKFAPYSFSKISTHESCPRKFKYTYIDKLPRGESDKTALYKGTCLHDMLEKYPELSTNKLVPKYQYIFDGFLKTKYKALLDIPSKREEGMGLTEDLEPIRFSKDAMLRGYIDFYTIIGDTMIIVDYKSGRSKDPRFQDYNQLMYYAIFMFQKYSKIQKIKIMYIYIEHNVDNALVLERKYLDNYVKTLHDNIQNVETSNFEKKETKLCEWCDYEEFCGTDV